MRKSYFILPLIAVALIFSYCKSSGKASGSKKHHKTVFQNELQTVIVGNCSPCHIPEKGGKKKAYDNFANVQADIDEMIRRIELNPGDKGFMPFRADHKLNDSTIAVFKKWKEDGMLEK